MVCSPAPIRLAASRLLQGIFRSGVSRPWDAQPHIFMARGLAAFSRMFVQFFIFSPTRSPRRGVMDCCLSRGFYFRFSNKSKNNCHVRRRRNRNVLGGRTPGG